MHKSSFALLAILGIGTTLVGCSGFQPFWQNGSNNDMAARRSVEGPVALARLAEQRGKTLDAERLYKSILEKSPDNPAVYHRLAVIESQKGHFEEANRYFDQALRLKPDDPTLICDAGYCQYLQQRHDVAESLFRQVLDMDPQHEAATNNLALLLGQRGDDQAAFALFRQVGTEAKAHVNMGFVYSQRGDLAKAKDAFNRALTKDPKMLAAAEALIQLRQFEQQSKAQLAASSRANHQWAQENAAAPHGAAQAAPAQASLAYDNPNADRANHQWAQQYDTAPHVAVQSAPVQASPSYENANADWVEYRDSTDTFMPPGDSQVHPSYETRVAFADNATEAFPTGADTVEADSLPEPIVTESDAWQSGSAPLPPPMPGGFSAPVEEMDSASQSAPLPPAMPYSSESQEALMDVPQSSEFGWHIEQQ